MGPASGVGTPPVVVVGGPRCVLSGTRTVCQSANRQLTLDLSGSTSPTVNTPATFLTVSNNFSAAVLNATSEHPMVQIT